MMIAMSSPVWQTKPSISRPSPIAFATSPSTARHHACRRFRMPADGADVSLDDRKSESHEHSLRPAQRGASALAAPGRRRCSFAEKNVLCSVRFHKCPSFSKARAHPVAGIIDHRKGRARSDRITSSCVAICCGARVRCCWAHFGRSAMSQLSLLSAPERTWIILKIVDVGCP